MHRLAIVVLFYLYYVCTYILLYRETYMIYKKQGYGLETPQKNVVLVLVT